MSDASIEAVFGELGLGVPSEEQRKAWDGAMTSFSPTKGSELLSGTLRDPLGHGILRAVPRELLRATLELVLKREALQRLAWFQYQELHQTPWGIGSGQRLWPKAPENLGEEGRLFDALVLLACVPSIRAYHTERGIPSEITLDTLSDLELWIHEEKRLTGAWGFSHRGWLGNHFSGRLFKLGRLQFETHPFQHRFHAFRHRKDRRVVLFAGAGQRFRADGYYDGANGIRGENGFTSTFSCDTQVIRGTPIEPARGIARREPLAIDASAWSCIFGEHDPCLGVHIPAAGPMDHAACGASFRLAAAFFPRYFPERPFKAFACSSWLLDAQFEDYLKAESNIVQWLREWLLYPIPGASDAQHLERVFDKNFDKERLASNPQTSSVQRAMVEHLKRGKDWIKGGSLYFPEDLNWGAQVYRKMGLPDKVD